MQTVVSFDYDQMTAEKTAQTFEEWMDVRFGPENWVLDARAGKYIAVDKDYRGPGRGFIVVIRSRDWIEHEIHPLLIN